MGVRVIGGKFRGRNLLTEDLPGLRPTTDRVRESIFNIIATRIDLGELNILDLCAGSGALGIEALSRGARHCDFVEKSRRTAGLLKRNIATLGLEENARIIVDDVLHFLKQAATYDLVLADPPYKASFLNEIVSLVPNILSDDGFFLLEHSPEFLIAPTPMLEPVVARTFGNTSVSIFCTAE